MITSLTKELLFFLLSLQQFTRITYFAIATYSTLFAIFVLIRIAHFHRLDFFSFIVHHFLSMFVKFNQSDQPDNPDNPDSSCPHSTCSTCFSVFAEILILARLSSDVWIILVRN